MHSGTSVFTLQPPPLLSLKLSHRSGYIISRHRSNEELPIGQHFTFLGLRKSSTCPHPTSMQEMCPASSMKDVRPWWLPRRNKLNLTNPESHLLKEDSIFFLFSTISTYLALLIIHRNRRVKTPQEKARQSGMDPSQVSRLYSVLPQATQQPRCYEVQQQEGHRLDNEHIPLKYPFWWNSKAKPKGLFCPLRRIYFSAITSLTLCEDMCFSNC